MLAVILAAGKGTRMRSSQPKVVFPLCGKPMIRRVTDSLKGAGVEEMAVVVGHEAEDVKNALNGQEGISFFLQNEQLGTGHAVKQVDFTLFSHEYVLILPGDVPLLDPKKLRLFIQKAQESLCDAFVLTTQRENPSGYGRILTKGELFEKIVEEKDASPAQKVISRINTGVYLIKKKHLTAYLPLLTAENTQKEYYLTDLFHFLVRDGLRVEYGDYFPSEECMGVNSRVQLQEANHIFKMRVLKKLMEEGVTVNHPEGVVLEGDLRCEEDCTILAPVVFKGEVRLKKGAVAGPFGYFENCELGPETNGEWVKISNKGVNPIF